MSNPLGNITISGAGLLLKKTAVAFALGFLAGFTPGATQLLDALSGAVAGETDFSIVLSLLTGLITGSISAAARAVLAYWTNIVPADAVHGPKAKKKNVTITTPPQ